MEMEVINNPSLGPTFVSHSNRGSSFVDITAATYGVSNDLYGWESNNRWYYNSSDHAPITWKWHLAKKRLPPRHRRANNKNNKMPATVYNLNRTDWSLFGDTLENSMELWNAKYSLETPACEKEMEKEVAHSG